MSTSILEEQIGLRQLASDTFAARWHKDWTVGSSKSWKLNTCRLVLFADSVLALLGGCVASVIQLTAQTYFRNDPALLKVNQPDVLCLHIEFLRVCTHHDSIIKVVPLRVGAMSSTVQLQLL